MSDRADRMKYYSTRLREEFTRNGPIGLGKAVALNLKRKVLTTNKATWYQLSLDKFSPLWRTEAPVEFDLMNIEEASRFFKKNHNSFPWMFFERELYVAKEAGHLFPCLRDGGEVVGYIKLGSGKVFVLDFERILNIPPGAAFVYDTFVMPSHRGMGLGRLLIEMTAGMAREKRFRSLWCHIPSWNEPSIRAFTKAGFKAVGDVRFFRLLGKEFLYKRPKTVPLSFDGVLGKSGEIELNEAPAG